MPTHPDQTTIAFTVKRDGALHRAILRAASSTESSLSGLVRNTVAKTLKADGWL